MSYGLKLVGRAKVRSRAALPAEVQEAVLDLLEALAARAGPGDDEPSSQHVLLYRDGARVFKVFIATDTDHSGQILLVPSIWYIATV